MMQNKAVASWKAKQYRETIVENIDVKPRCINMWMQKYNHNIDEYTWKTMNITKETRLKALQWKIIHNIYPTNIMLHKMGISPSENCSFCNVKDYVEHFFYKCKQICKIWKHTELLMSSKIGKHITITEKDVIIGYSGHDTRASALINHVIMIAKLCISKYRYGKPYDICLMFDNEASLRMR